MASMNKIYLICIQTFELKSITVTGCLHWKFFFYRNTTIHSFFSWPRSTWHQWPMFSTVLNLVRGSFGPGGNRVVQKGSSWLMKGAKSMGRQHISSLIVHWDIHYSLRSACITTHLKTHFDDGGTENLFVHSTVSLLVKCCRENVLKRVYWRFQEICGVLFPTLKCVLM